MSSNSSNDSRGFLRLLLIAVSVFVIVLALLEFAVGFVFIALISDGIEANRKKEFALSWNRYLSQRKLVHESKVTGYAWWNEVARAFKKKDYKYIQEDAFGGDASLTKNYDVFIGVGRNMDLFYGAIDSRTTSSDPGFVAAARDLEMEKHFYKLTKAKLKELYPVYLRKIIPGRKKLSIEKIVVWHYITVYNKAPRLLTLSPICQNEGYPFTEGYLLFGYKMDKILRLAGEIIPARIRLHTKKPANAYLVLEQKGFRPDETFYISFEPNILIADSARNTLYILILTQIIISLGVFLVVGPYFTRRYTRDLEVTIDERTTQLREANAELRERQKEIVRELKLARVVQQNLLPDRDIIGDNIRLSCLYVPAADLGGDIFDVVTMGRGAWGLLVADVAGHGVPAALISMMVKLSFVNHARPENDPARTLTDMNGELCKFLSHGDYLTAAYLLLDARAGKLRFAMGAHREILHYQAATEEIHALEAEGTIIGAFENAEFVAGEIALGAGDKLFIYTDGLVEERNAQGEEFGEERLRRAIFQLRNDDIRNIKQSLYKTLTEFMANAGATDDITLVVVEIGSEGDGKSSDSDPMEERRKGSGRRREITNPG